eukprot:6208611-Pleurochrysis_carterae.AAC.1
MISHNSDICTAHGLIRTRCLQRAGTPNARRLSAWHPCSGASWALSVSLSISASISPDSVDASARACV